MDLSAMSSSAMSTGDYDSLPVDDVGQSVIGGYYPPTGQSGMHDSIASLEPIDEDEAVRSALHTKPQAKGPAAAPSTHIHQQQLQQQQAQQHINPHSTQGSWTAGPTSV